MPAAAERLDPWVVLGETQGRPFSPQFNRRRHLINLAKFPRIRCGHFPTPLERMENLTKYLDGPKLWIKRDDCTGLSTGGSEARKLEFLMADACAQKADTVITQGATQSNHARQTAAIAAKLRMTCHILLEDRTGYEDEVYNGTGKVALARCAISARVGRPPSPGLRRPI